MPPVGTDDFDVILPGRNAQGDDQDAEWCEVTTADGRRRVRFHDYHEIYAIQGLYEHLFYEQLKCTSPTVVRELLAEALEHQDRTPDELVILDLGAGNGMVGEELTELGVDEIVAVDIIPEAAEAAQRDRPGTYDAYHVVDLTADAPEVDDALASAEFTGLTCVAALGFGDIPPLAFARGLDAVADGGLVAFNIKDRFLEDSDESGFSRLVRQLLDDRRLEVVAERRYRHRLSATGEPLHYLAYVAVKRPGPGSIAELVT